MELLLHIRNILLHDRKLTIEGAQKGIAGACKTSDVSKEILFSGKSKLFPADQIPFLRFAVNVAEILELIGSLTIRLHDNPVNSIQIFSEE